LPTVRSRTGRAVPNSAPGGDGGPTPGTPLSSKVPETKIAPPGVAATEPLQSFPGPPSVVAQAALPSGRRRASQAS